MMLVKILKTQMIVLILKALSSTLIFVFIFTHWVTPRSSVTDDKMDEISSISLLKKDSLNSRQFLANLKAFPMLVLFHRNKYKETWKQQLQEWLKTIIESISFIDKKVAKWPAIFIAWAHHAPEIIIKKVSLQNYNTKCGKI